MNLSTVMAKTQDGDTALILAAWHGHTEIARLLLECGANKNMKNDVRINNNSSGARIFMCLHDASSSVVEKPEFNDSRAKVPVKAFDSIYKHFMRMLNMCF